jgi:succinylglutamate desuccinylase
MLVAAGALEAAQVPTLAMHRERLAGLALDLPAVSEIRHRHVVRPEHEPFVMLPGFVNFQAIARGQLIAHDARGPVHAPLAGRMMLPRYQGLGDDGYFIAAAVSPLALHVSAALRLLQLDRLVPLLPGIRRHPERADHFIADPQVARTRVVDVFHLFGYRHVRTVGADLVFTRRAPGAQGVRSMPAEVQVMASRAGGRGR